ncbi:MAG: oligopeptidase B, partial [Ferruginibacter sp.]
MQKNIMPAIIIAALVISSCNNKDSEMTKTAYTWADSIAPPVAEKKAKELIAHGDTRIDNYYWMNDYFKKGPDSTKVVDYLKAENAYYDTMMSGTKTLQENLYTEMKARIKEKDESVPTFKNGYFYYSRVVEGKDYFVYCRKKGNLQAAEEVLLDVNAMAEGHNYFSATGFDVSMDNKLLAYGIDMLSRRQYDIYIKNLETGEIYKDKIPNTEGGPVWANDNLTLFYTSKNAVTLLSEKIKRHKLGTDAATDKTVYEEKDPTNYIGVSKTKSDKFILIGSGATLSSEYRYIDANKPEDAFKIFQPRMKEVLYDVDHANDKFYIRTNLQAKNFKVMTCDEMKTDSASWATLIAHNDKVLIQGFDLFKNYLAISERKDGLTQIHILNTKDNSSHYLPFDEAAYAANLA